MWPDKGTSNAYPMLTIYKDSFSGLLIVTIVIIEHYTSWNVPQCITASKHINNSRSFCEWLIDTLT